MSRGRFEWGRPYLLNDLKEGVFVDEPAIFVGKKDSDMKRPTICAVCGQPLGAKGYSSFFLTGPNGRGRDMMIGNGCIRDRIKAREIDINTGEFMEKWNRVIAEFPKSGRWYGTFLHHCIAKPYVRNKKVAERWDESILDLPGVSYIMGIIDEYRDSGWRLDAELRLDCGSVDLLVTHPDKGTIVFDWKSDLSFENHEAYVDQVVRYMYELTGAGMHNVTGNIVWVKDSRLEPVPFEGVVGTTGDVKTRSYTSSPLVKCSLNIDMGGGEGIRRKRMIEYSHRRIYGNEVSFFIPRCSPYKRGYDFGYFEAPPYREGELSQWFDMNDAENGIRVSFICSKKRRSFTFTANWRKTRPLECLLEIHRDDDGSHPNFYIIGKSKIDNEKKDYVEFGVSEINGRMNGRAMVHAILNDDGAFAGVKTEWKPDELQEGMKIRIPCTEDCCRFQIKIKTIAKPVDEEKHPLADRHKPQHGTTSMKPPGRRGSSPSSISDLSAMSDSNLDTYRFVSDITPVYQKVSMIKADIAEYGFIPGRIYESGGRYYGIYRRRESERNNACGKVDVAEVDCTGKRVSHLEWRHVYTTRGGKEYIYGLANNHGWRIYTKNVVSTIRPEGWVQTMG